jgi:signal transduction histidine kinase
VSDDEDPDRELERLREALLLQENFLAVVAHELRNPLGPVLMSVGALLAESKERPVPHDVLIRRLSMMHRYVERLRDDLDRLLDFSRIRSGRIDLQLEDVDLSEIVTRTLEEMQPMLDASCCKVDVALAQPLVGRWDNLRLRQVIWNLVSNAAKYAAGAPIEIRTHGDPQSAVFVIRDHGPGIASRDRELVFRKFERSTRQHTGFGVGLWLVQRIAEALGGTVTLESTINEGTTFTVTLPRNR